MTELGGACAIAAARFMLCMRALRLRMLRDHPDVFGSSYEEFEQQSLEEVAQEVVGNRVKRLATQEISRKGERRKDQTKGYEYRARN